MESITLDPPSLKLTGVPSSGSSRRRSSRSGGRYLGSGGIRKNSIGSNNGDGRNSPIVREMAAILGSSSPDVSPTTSGPPSGLPSVRDGMHLSNMGNSNSINSTRNRNNNSMHRRGSGSDHGNVTGGRERASSQASDRDIHMSGVSQSGSQINGSNNGQSRKRESVDGVEYPRRRATIAVRTHSLHFSPPHPDSLSFTFHNPGVLTADSAKYVDQESPDVMALGQSAVSALN